MFFTAMVAFEKAKFPPPWVEFVFGAAVAVASTPGALVLILIVERALDYSGDLVLPILY